MAARGARPRQHGHRLGHLSHHAHPELEPSSSEMNSPAKFQISSNGGAQPRWKKNGKEIFYVSLDSKMMAAPLKLSPDGQSLETGTPTALFSARIADGPLPGVNQ